MAFASISSLVLIFGYFIFSKNKLARFYSVGAITPFLAIFIILISTWVNLGVVANIVSPFIGLGPILALGLAMAYRFKIINEEKELAQIHTKKVLEEQNITLERQVADRTKELTKTVDHLKTTQSQLVHAEKMASLGELTAGIAHEIQNPLNFVTNFSEVSEELLGELKEEIKQGDIQEVISITNDLEQNIGKIIHHGKRADAIVKGMLQHSRSSSGNKELSDINALVEEYLRLAYHGISGERKVLSM